MLHAVYARILFSVAFEAPGQQRKKRIPVLVERNHRRILRCDSSSQHHRDKVLTISNLTQVSSLAKAYMPERPSPLTVFPNPFLGFLFLCPPCSGLPSPHPGTSSRGTVRRNHKCSFYCRVCFGVSSPSLQSFCHHMPRAR